MKVGLIATSRLPNQSLRIMCDLLRERQIDPLPLLLRAGIDPLMLDDPWGTVSGAQELAFQRTFKTITAPIPGLWYQTGLRYRTLAYGPLGLGALTSATITDGLRLFTDMQALGYALFQWISVERDGLSVGLLANTYYAPPDMLEFLHERGLGAAPTFISDLLNGTPAFSHIESALDRPRNWLGLDTIWQTEIRYNCPRTMFHFAPGAGSRPLPMASPLLAANYRRLCLNMIETTPRHNSLATQCTQLLMQARAPFPSAAEAARALHLSERSLHRKLATLGTRYQVILDNVRLRRARELLEAGALPVAEIAERLGFAELASFSRFFTRVAGTAPSVYRRRSQEIFDETRAGAQH